MNIHKKHTESAIEKLEALQKQWCEEDGKVYCEQCSVPNQWKVYHLPGKHAKK